LALGLIVTAALAAAGAAGPAHGQLGATSTPTPTPVVTLAPGTRVTYPPGWNLVAGPTGTTLTGVSTLYTYQATDTSYVTLDGTTPLVAGNGYWAYFNVLAAVQILGPTPPTFSRPLPVGHYVLIGNPRESLVIVSGADVVYVYDPVAGYEPTTVLEPGQGAWAFSAAGGTLSFTNLAP
jgi:hypothetical protein